MELNKIAIVIPARNEGKTIGNIAAELSKHFTTIVIDDGSIDNTARVATNNGAYVKTNLIGVGYDNAISQGFKIAAQRGFDAVITMDADGEHSPQCVWDMSYYLRREIPLIIGKRKKYGRMTEALFGWFCQVKYGISDPFCGMKGYSLKLVKENDGFKHCECIGIELCLNSIQKGCKFAEVPVYGEIRIDKSRFGSVFRANIRIISAIIAYYYYRVNSND